MLQCAPQTGRFIVLEGLEGCGKTTNAAWVASYLERCGQSVVLTREPGGTPVAESIREWLLAVDVEPISPLAELYLMFAARMQHMTQKIKPLLDAGTWVVCDRFLDATKTVDAHVACGMA
ncbi:MAG: dTMP kinase [Gammaproteobacteria bacterium]